MIKSISVKYDDRDASSKGWFASFYDENYSEIFQETSGYPIRRDASKKAVAVAKRDAKHSRHSVSNHVRIEVYASISDALPTRSESW